MQVSTQQPFKIVYSLYQHEYLGFLIESFVVQVDQNGNLTLQHQNISSANAAEFSAGLEESDYDLIRILDSMQQEAVILHFNKKKVKPDDFFQKVYKKETGNETLQKEIHNYLERRRAKALDLLKDKLFFEMGSDGEPAWREINVQQEKATVLFHFRRNEDNTHYFPTIKHNGEKVDFQYNGSYLICHQPAWLMVKGKLYHFEKDIDGQKLSPFLNKKFIVIPKKVEETYYEKFVSNLVENYDVYAKGFDITTLRQKPKPVVVFSELASVQQDMFDEKSQSDAQQKIIFEVLFRYNGFTFRNDGSKDISVRMEKQDDQYSFYRIERNKELETDTIDHLRKSGLPLKNSRATLTKSKAFSWISNCKEELLRAGVELKQESSSEKTYYLGEPEFQMEIRENIDWFDIHAIVKFGEYEVPFSQVRDFITKNKPEFQLPNGQVAVIPEEWFEKYGELLSFTEVGDDEKLQLKKHHLALVQELEMGHAAKVSMDRKLERLREFEKIEDVPLPESFKGDLRPYQKEGFNWMNFLNKYRFGGCLADDMGLGKTVQTLAMLQAHADSSPPEERKASLLIMPTSLVYNWEMEARKFTPGLKVFNYTGTNREKDISLFQDYDLILTSYGIIRLDLEILKNYFFDYIILDESQAIKNPGSIISKSVRQLRSKFRLILTGTPLENSTMDLWSQISFINPGLLGSQKFFKKEYLVPIEKKGDARKIQKLHTIIKPFILRRNKSQVASELPDKVEKVEFCTMTTMQKQKYEEVKSAYRNKILDHIESHGLGKSQFILLQGLSQLRQIANHPKMVDLEYPGDSGKMEDVIYKIENTLSEGHKILIFSQFVKHLTIVREHLDTAKINYSYLDGSTRDRQKEVNRFQQEKDRQVFLISLKAGGLGLNLTEADYVFLLDPWWNPAVEAQAVDRAHRIGQKRKVFTYRFISRDTVEEKILQLQKHKLSLASNLISTEESFMKSLSKDDVESLFT